MISTNMANDHSLLASAELCEGRVNITWHDGFSACYHDISLRHSPGFPGARRPAGPEGRFLRDKQSTQVIAAEISESGELLLIGTMDAAQSTMLTGYAITRMWITSIRFDKE